MRTIKVKLGSLKQLIEVTTDVETFGEFHKILASQSGELFDLEQIDATKHDFVDMNTLATYGQRDDAKLPLNNCYLMVVTRNNKGAAINKVLKDFYYKLHNCYSENSIQDLRRTVVINLLNEWREATGIFESTHYATISSKKLRRILYDVYIGAEAFIMHEEKGLDKDMKEPELDDNEEKESMYTKTGGITILKDPELKPIMTPDCEKCPYKKHYEEEVTEVEYQRLNHERVRR